MAVGPGPMDQSGRQDSTPLTAGNAARLTHLCSPTCKRLITPGHCLLRLEGLCAQLTAQGLNEAGACLAQ